jgi:hypothetical protein
MASHRPVVQQNVSALDVIQHNSVSGICNFVRATGRVLYRLVDIEAYEASCLSTSTKSAVAENVAA